MTYTDAARKATNKYREKYAEIRCRVTKQEKKMIEDNARALGLSVSEYSKRAILKELKLTSN